MRKLRSSIAVVIAALASLGLPSTSFAVQPSAWVSGEYRKGDFELLLRLKANTV